MRTAALLVPPPLVATQVRVAIPSDALRTEGQSCEAIGEPGSETCHSRLTGLVYQPFLPFGSPVSAPG